jgi:serine/threonine-protein phosphatase 2A regulatory subunit A
VAKTLQRIYPHVDQNSLQNQVKPSLEKLMQDADFDVRYFASEAMDAIANRAGGEGLGAMPGAAPVAAS